MTENEKFWKKLKEVHNQWAKETWHPMHTLAFGCQYTVPSSTVFMNWAEKILLSKEKRSKRGYSNGSINLSKAYQSTMCEECKSGKFKRVV